ncbi:MAG: DUF6371 domain-containing protein [Prevotellaceae bacterium]|jgi:hypothetical protein|nr:DUF6371 domain-containing protein [Prevotellaceae bacterium]
MNTDFRYKLTKRGKAVCPECGRKTFVLYIDSATGEPLHSTVGKCDRSDNCGHHYSPKQYFQDNHIPFDTVRNSTPYRKPNPKPQPVPSYIDADIFKKSLQGYENNTLVQYLYGIVGDEATRQTVERYYIGTAKNGGTIFWQIDGCGKIRTGKAIQYAEDGHRRKDVMPPVSWVHTILKLPDFSLMQCFFGEHLLRDATKMVAIVESEKTAIIASVYLPQFIWLACGGSEGLNIDKCRCLKGRDVVLYPDCGMFDKWNNKAEVLRTICKSVSVSNLIETAASEAERKAGFDLSDYLARFSPSEFSEPQAHEKQPQEQPPSDTQPEQDKKYPAYVSDAGIVYIPTPPDGCTTYTVYSSVEAYNKRSELPRFVPFQSVDIAGMKQVFINLNTLTI